MSRNCPPPAAAERYSCPLMNRAIMPRYLSVAAPSAAAPTAGRCILAASKNLKTSGLVSYECDRRSTCSSRTAG